MKKTILLALSAIVWLSPAPKASAQTSPLDPTFGNGGISMLDSVDAFVGVDMALQEDGRILIAVNGNCNHGFLCRLLSNGKLDSTFQPSLPYRTYPVYHPGVIEMQGASCNINMTTVRQLTSRKILWSIGPMAVFQYNADGTTDTTFGNKGNTSLTSTNPLSIQNIMDTKEVAGTGVLFAGSTFPPPMADSFSLARMKYNGSIDPAFGTNGYVRVALPVSKVGPYSLIQCMKILPDNRVLVAGNCITPGSATSVDIFMALYNPNGSLDATFGNGGVKVLDFNNAWDDVYKIAYRDNNNIYMLGTSGTNRIAYKTDITGKIDNTFGNNGLVTFPYTSFNGNAWYIGTVSHSNYLYTCPDTGSAQQQNYFSYKGTGSANTSFGNMGYYTAGTRDRVSNMLAQPDNKILVLGTNGLRPRLLRFLGSGTTSVPDISPEAGINAWAANGHCFISFSQKVPSFSATLLNVEGKVMGRWSEQNTDITGDQIKVLKLPADMPQGIYLMRIDSQVGTKIIRLSL